MIELTDRQVRRWRTPKTPRRAHESPDQGGVRLAPRERNGQLTEEYDDSSWTRDKLQALAWDAGEHIGWADMDDYDDVPEQP